jgi:putative transposase
VQGVSTRKVAQITEELCGTEFSKSTVSALCKRLDTIVQAWNERPLKEHRHPCLLVHALVVKVRENGRVRTRSVMIATGINEEGYREIVGVMLGDGESEVGWRGFFAWLKERGLSGVDVVVSDSRQVLVKALLACFSECTWQRCQTHFMRNLLDATPKSLQTEVYQRVRAILDAPDPDTARLLLNQVLRDYSQKGTKINACAGRGI